MLVRTAIILFAVSVGMGNAWGMERITHQSTDVAIIANKGIEDTKSFIIEQVRKQLKGHFSSDEYRFKVQARWIPHRLLQQSPEQILGVQLQGEVRRYTNFEVFYRLHGDRRRTEIQLKVEASQKIPVVIDRVERGVKLTKEQLALQWVSLSRNNGNYITNIEKLVGKTLRRTLLSGQPIRSTDVSRDLIVQAGDEVKVIIKRNGVQVQVTGKARENGAKGDRIKIYSNDTRKKYTGEVLRPGVIQWKSTL